ncbi:uncharacterized protein [Periplaneta americana]|uniref:uncharacterized protein n=1 Tax=Periplaneta americana TaxID=6978 RepID=UPI0037E6FEF5
MSDTSEKWQRPKSVPVPTIWRRCDGLREMEDGKIPKFVIQDVPEDMHEEIVEFMTVYFCRDEVMSASLKFLDDPVSVKELQDIWRTMLIQNIGLVAFVDDGEDGDRRMIAGCNVTGVSYKGEKITSEKFQGRCSKRVVRDLAEYGSNIVDVYERYGVNEYMTAMGLCVDPVFRGQGVGLELLKARFDLGKAVGLKATMTIFTGVASQKLAYKVGMEVLAEVFYDDLQEDGKPVYPNIKSKSMKIMAKRIE